MMSTPKSISLLGGTPSISLGKTSGNSFTTETETYLIGGILARELIRLSVGHLETNFFALRYEMNDPLALLNYFSTFNCFIGN